MKKFAVIIATLAFCAGCADNDPGDMTETEIETTEPIGTGTAAPGETGMDRQPYTPAPEPMEPTAPEPQLEPSPQPQAEGQQPLGEDITITTTNELNIDVSPEEPQPELENNPNP